MGFQPAHARETWVNEQAYMAPPHGQTGTKPGSGAFSLTGQPSRAARRARSARSRHRLPADIRSTTPSTARAAEARWKLPAKTINPKVGSPHHGNDARPRRTGRSSGSGSRSRTRSNPPRTTTTGSRPRAQPGTFVVVSDAYPASARSLRPDPAERHDLREGVGGYGNSSAARSSGRQQVPAPGDGRPTSAGPRVSPSASSSRKSGASSPLPGPKADGFTRASSPPFSTMP